MTGLEWFLGVMLIGIYITAIFTVCMMTFRKGHTVLGIIGIFLPFLWLIGAILPSKEGSSYDVQQAERYNAQMREYTR